MNIEYKRIGKIISLWPLILNENPNKAEAINATHKVNPNRKEKLLYLDIKNSVSPIMRQCALWW